MIVISSICIYVSHGEFRVTELLKLYGEDWKGIMAYSIIPHFLGTHTMPL
jgi:hypothetical protein